MISIYLQLVLEGYNCQVPNLLPHRQGLVPFQGIFPLYIKACIS